MNTKRILLLVPFGICTYLVELFLVPRLGMFVSQLIAAVLVLALLGAYLLMAGREPDERERYLRLQADSAALYVVIAGLLAAAIFYPHSSEAMAFWLVLGLAVFGRIGAFLYHRYK